MPVMIVTDSGSDITQEEARNLGITVVPLYLRFGQKTYRDGVDIDCDKFYRMLATSPVHPGTSSPSPGDFARVYEKLGNDTEDIVSIHLTPKHSATYNSALLGKQAVEKKRRIEVIDSRGVTIWQGLVTIAAAKAAQAQKSLHQVIAAANETISHLRALGLLDTLTYITRGGRVGKVIATAQTILSVKPMLTIRDGQIRPAGVVRTRSAGLEQLRKLIASSRAIQELAIAYSTTPEDAHTLADHARALFPGISPRVSRIGPALGVHSGPGAIFAALTEARP